MGNKIKNPPGIFRVNWFRTDAEGKFIWPGFGENLRVLAWIIQRTSGGTPAVETPIGYMPRPEDINLEGSGISKEKLASELLSLDKIHPGSSVPRSIRFYPNSKAPRRVSLSKSRCLPD